jgi:cysteine-rich repeat protein
MRSVASFVLVTAACVGPAPSPPQHDGGTTTGPGSTTVVLDTGVGPTGDDAGSTAADSTNADSTDAGSTDAGSTDAGSTETSGPRPVCGNAIIEAPEECDLGEPKNGNGSPCTDTCTINVCGDGYVGPGEACDDGNDSDEDLCTTLCEVASCGDGAVQASEECDDGMDNAEDGACLPSCVEATCGDQFVHAGVESCDGNNIGENSCVSEGFDSGVLLCADDCADFDTSNCNLCGNGVLEPGEACDGSDFGGATCASVDPAYRGPLFCFTDCIIDSAYCCLDINVPCSENAQCCTSNCDPMTSMCGPQ